MRAIPSDVNAHKSLGGKMPFDAWAMASDDVKLPCPELDLRGAIPSDFTVVRGADTAGSRWWSSAGFEGARLHGPRPYGPAGAVAW